MLQKTVQFTQMSKYTYVFTEQFSQVSTQKIMLQEASCLSVRIWEVSKKVAMVGNEPQ